MIGAANGSSRSVPAQCSRQPSTWTVSVWPMNSSRLPPPAPLRFAPDIGPAGQEIRATRDRSRPSACISLFEEGDEIRLVAGDAFAADGAAQQRDRRRRDRARRASASVKSFASSSALPPAARPALAGGSEMRPSGASTPNSVLCRWPSPIAAAPTIAARAPSSLASTVDRIGEAARQQRLHPLDQISGRSADRAAEDDLFRIGDRGDGARCRAPDSAPSRRAPRRALSLAGIGALEDRRAR